MSVPNPTRDSTPEGARPTGRGYWFTPLPTYLLDAVYDANSPVNAPAVILWAHIHRHYAWREKIFPSCATLADETGLGERTIARLLQTLRTAGALTWDAGFSSKGRSSNQYALAPFKAFEFDREPSLSVPAKSGNHRGVPAESGSHPPAKNGRGIKSSSYLESTDESLSPPSVPKQRTAEPPPASERETDASPSKTSTAQRVIRDARVLAEGEDEQAFIAWATKTHQPRGGGWWIAVHDRGDLPAIADTWRTEQTPAASKTAASLPDWCEQCDRAEYRWVCDDEGRWAKCGNCHPDLAPARPAPRQDTGSHNTRIIANYRARTSGHVPFQCPPDSAYDLGWDGQPVPDTQAAR